MNRTPLLKLEQPFPSVFSGTFGSVRASVSSTAIVATPNEAFQLGMFTNVRGFNLFGPYRTNPTPENLV